jgi:hypothetical protein
VINDYLFVVLEPWRGEETAAGTVVVDSFSSFNLDQTAHATLCRKGPILNETWNSPSLGMIKIY